MEIVKTIIQGLLLCLAISYFVLDATAVIIAATNKNELKIYPIKHGILWALFYIACRV